MGRARKRTHRDYLVRLEAHHPSFAFAWGTGIGRKLQNLDSQMCAKVQRLMRNQNHPVLSVHDSFVVGTSQERALRIVMDDVLSRTIEQLRLTEHPRVVMR